MTTRRSFLKWSIGVLASVALAQRLVLDALTVVPGRDEVPELKINPAWIDAPYEVIYHPQCFLMSERKNLNSENPDSVERFRFVDGQYVKVERHLA